MPEVAQKKVEGKKCMYVVEESLKYYCVYFRGKLSCRTKVHSLDAQCPAKVQQKYGFPYLIWIYTGVEHLGSQQRVGAQIIF